MSITTLKKGTNRAVFTWAHETGTMSVDITVDELSECQKGKMSRAAAREFWKILKGQGYTE